MYCSTVRFGVLCTALVARFEQVRSRCEFAAEARFITQVPGRARVRAGRPFLGRIPLMTALDQSPLRRFVADGLRDTIAAYSAGTLPLHRFAWELDSRLSTLAELTGLPHWRTLTALRAAQRTIADLDTTLRANTGGANTGGANTGGANTRAGLTAA